MSDPLHDALRKSGDSELELPRVTPRAPSLSLRERLLNAATLEGRFDRFIKDVAAMLDLSDVNAKFLLDTIDTPGSFSPELPGASFFWLPGGPRTKNAVRGFVRIEVGTELPPHTHLGKEQVLVLQGIYVDSETGKRYLPGDRLEGDISETHHFCVGEGTDLLMAVVVEEGYRLGEMVIGPREYEGPELPE